MNKNLKKVISAVAALALSASSFVALAANYPDVDSSASYKQAVDELSALNVINGYEDGTFQPDGNVTYEQVAKMIVCAMNFGETGEYYGGYPNGYLKAAADMNITKNAAGTTGVASELLRKQQRLRQLQQRLRQLQQQP